MIILPKNDSSKARKLFDAAISIKNRVTMLIFGEDNGEDQIASKADTRAQSLANVRQVVWIRDLDFLTQEERKSFTNNDSTILACCLNLDDFPVAFLNKKEANSFLKIEKAFLRAESIESQD